MNEKRKLKLNPLEGNLECILEVELLENGDMFVGMRGQDRWGKNQYVSAQIPNPVNGGGNQDDYEILEKIYDFLRKNKNKNETK